jgi:hypothetical protein
MFGGGRAARRKKDGERKEKLKQTLLKQAETTRASDGARAAIAYCDSSIDEYEEFFEWNESRWVWWQQIIIVGGAVATLAGVITVPERWLWWISDPQSLAWLRGVPAAIVTVAAGYLSNFTYREDAVRHELTAETLLIELAKYIGKAEPYNKGAEQDDTSAFLNTVCLLVETESRNWSALVSKVAVDNTSLPPSPPPPPGPTPGLPS